MFSRNFLVSYQQAQKIKVSINIFSWKGKIDEKLNTNIFCVASLSKWKKSVYGQQVSEKLNNLFWDKRTSIWSLIKVKRQIKEKIINIFEMKTSTSFYSNKYSLLKAFQLCIMYMCSLIGYFKCLEYFLKSSVHSSRVAIKWPKSIFNY